MQVDTPSGEHTSNVQNPAWQTRSDWNAAWFLEEHFSFDSLQVPTNLFFF